MALTPPVISGTKSASTSWENTGGMLPRMIAVESTVVAIGFMICRSDLLALAYFQAAEPYGASLIHSCAALPAFPLPV